MQDVDIGQEGELTKVALKWESVEIERGRKEGRKEGGKEFRNNIEG
jgi:hypothetical protein